MGKQKEDKPAGKGAENIIVSDFYKDIRCLIEEVSCRVASMVNAAITMLYWQIGKRINEEILKGKRAEYGREIIVSLARQLVLEYGNNFSEKKSAQNDSICRGLPIQRDCRIADTTFKLELYLCWLKKYEKEKDREEQMSREIYTKNEKHRNSI